MLSYIIIYIDTESIQKRTLTRIAAEYGKEFPDDLRGKLLGRQEMEVAVAIIDALKIDLTPREFLDKVYAIESKEMKNVKLMPGKNISNKNVSSRLNTRSYRRDNIFGKIVNGAKHINYILNYV